MEHSGFYRRVSSGTPGAVWEEGPGWIIFDEQARIEGQAALPKPDQPSSEVKQAVRAERSACVAIALRYGGHAAQEIAEQIGHRSFCKNEFSILGSETA
jgi:hypothetical protein